MSDKQVNEKQLRKAYMDAFSTASGDLVLKDLANRCFRYSSTIPVPGMPSMGETTESNEGRRQVLLHIENMRSPEGLANLAEEPEKGNV